MEKLSCITLALFSCLVLSSPDESYGKDKGDSCISDSDCGFDLTCNDQVCVKKKEFDFGSSGKSGNSCDNDGDCIGSGKCVENNFGKKYCSGN